MIIYIVIADTYDDYVFGGVATDKLQADKMAEELKKVYTEEDYWTVNVEPYTDGVLYG